MSEKASGPEKRRCQLCPRRCGVDRLSGEKGSCGAGPDVKLASATIHFGEEPPISGTRGSATFFFSHCPLSCCFCQNFPISQLGYGRVTSVPDLAEKMIRLAKRGVHNINCVSGTQYAPQIVEAVARAKSMGLKIPVVWNTSGYELPETIDLLSGTVDIYLTDIKYRSNENAEQFSHAPNYFEIATRAAELMIKQVGPLEVDDNGIGRRGVVIRHLVLPAGLSGTYDVMRYIYRTYGTTVPVSLMGQYFPAYKAHGRVDLGRRLERLEYERAKLWVEEAGIQTGWTQDLNTSVDVTAKSAHNKSAGN